MMYEATKFAEAITKDIDDNVRRIEESLGEKSAKNYEEYVERCGVITGLLTVRRRIADLTKAMESHE